MLPCSRGEGHDGTSGSVGCSLLTELGARNSWGRKRLKIPMENVATIADCASVIEGVSRSRNALLNGDTKNYDWDSGYTCHQLGSGAIVVQLAQPYMIGSIRLLLWDCDDRSYSYYIEVSTNQQQWTMVADRTKVSCKSWQSVTFERQPASFIRIVGTHNTANEVRVSFLERRCDIS
uniref:BTB domain containing 9 n=1 Tax=Molossus molossus TaxID=27622 RepID=A0A7J8GNX1_MOLMO|nr:BTB domain containing 9 [Molossus molossus]